MNRSEENALVDALATRLRSFTARQLFRAKLNTHFMDLNGYTDREVLRVLGRACRLVEGEL